MNSTTFLFCLAILYNVFACITFAESEVSDTRKAFDGSDPLQSSLFSTFAETKLLLSKNSKVSSGIVERMIPEIVELAKIVENNAIEIKMSGLTDEEKSMKIILLIDRLNIATKRLAEVTIGVGKFEVMTETERAKIKQNPQEGGK